MQQSYTHPDTRVSAGLLHGLQGEDKPSPLLWTPQPTRSGFSVHSRGDGLSSPCTVRCLACRDACSLQKSYAHPRRQNTLLFTTSYATLKALQTQERGSCLKHHTTNLNIKSYLTVKNPRLKPGGL